MMDFLFVLFLIFGAASIIISTIDLMLTIRKKKKKAFVMDTRKEIICILAEKVAREMNDSDSIPSKETLNWCSMLIDGHGITNKAALYEFLNSAPTGGRGFMYWLHSLP